MNRPSPFSSSNALRDHFDAGLHELLDDYRELGAFILVLANACFDARLWPTMVVALRRRYDMLAREVGQRRLLGLLLDDAGDDLLVFEQLRATGFDRISPTEYLRRGPWEVQFNHLRQFRPQRLAGSTAPILRRPFDPESFNFDRPFLRKEIVWRGWLCGRNSALFYNKFPFVELHMLLVPEPGRGLSQYLMKADNEYIWRLTDVFSKTLPNVGFGYNSLGAGASVNHLHFQMFDRRQPLPIAESHWAHNGGGDDYPLPCHTFSGVDDSWVFLRRLHEAGVSYNLVYLPGRLYCLPRVAQGGYLPAQWSGGCAWHELAGAFTSFQRADFENLDQPTIESELAKLRLDTEFAGAP